MSTCKIKLDKEKGGGINPLNVAFSFYINLNKKPCKGVVTETTSFNDSEDKMKISVGSGKWVKSPDSITCQGFDIRPQIPQMPHIYIGHLNAHSPTFLTPRTSFMEDKFSMDSGGGRVGFRII